MTGKLEMYVGGMFAEKSTNLIRQCKRHHLAGKEVLVIKPVIDGRYAEDLIVTHDGVIHNAININTDLSNVDSFSDLIIKAEVVCIDEVQFFDVDMIDFIEEMLKAGVNVYVAGLDMDRFGKPFGIVPHLMAIAENVTKVHAVCAFCGDDSWISLGTENLKNENQVNVGNEYVPACRSCSYDVGTKVLSETK